MAMAHPTTNRPGPEVKHFTPEPNLFALGDRLSINLHDLRDQAALVAMAIDALEEIDTPSSFTNSADGLKYDAQRLFRGLGRAISDFSEFGKAAGVFRGGEAGGRSDA